MITVGIELISPQLATEYLKRNTRNRSIRQNSVLRFVSVIQSGHWRTTNQGIAFFENGDLADGQHRLMAIAKAGVPVPIQVTRGLTHEDAMAIDRGATRKYQDLTMWHDNPLKRSDIAITRVVAEYFYPGNIQRLTDMDIIGYTYKHLDAIRFATRITSGNTPLKNAVPQACLAAAYHYVESDALALFAKIASTGIYEINEHVAAVRLRNYCIETQRTGLSRASRLSLALKTQAAIRAFVQGRPLARLLELDELIYLFPDAGPVAIATKRAGAQEEAQL